MMIPCQYQQMVSHGFKVVRNGFCPSTVLLRLVKRGDSHTGRGGVLEKCRNVWWFHAEIPRGGSKLEHELLKCSARLNGLTATAAQAEKASDVKNKEHMVPSLRWSLTSYGTAGKPGINMYIHIHTCIYKYTGDHLQHTYIHMYNVYIYIYIHIIRQRKSGNAWDSNHNCARDIFGRLQKERTLLRWKAKGKAKKDPNLFLLDAGQVDC